jgi:Raf kinase inhibitor-like YbhB/YbcL family protein
LGIAPKVSPMRGMACTAAAGLCAAAIGCGGDGDGNAGDRPTPQATQTPPAVPATIRLSSPAFRDGGPIPRRHTCDDFNDSPRLRWSGVPAGTAELALVMRDESAPGGSFAHWVLFAIPAATRELAAGAAPSGARRGTNDFRQRNYGGPCPPFADEPHRYAFTLYALRAPLQVPEGAPLRDLEPAIDRVAIARGRLTGTYERTG